MKLISFNSSNKNQGETDLVKSSERFEENTPLHAPLSKKSAYIKIGECPYRFFEYRTTNEAMTRDEEGEGRERGRSNHLLRRRG